MMIVPELEFNFSVIGIQSSGKGILENIEI
jgi:hypothetical protein